MVNGAFKSDLLTCFYDYFCCVLFSSMCYSHWFALFWSLKKHNLYSIFFVIVVVTVALYSFFFVVVVVTVALYSFFFVVVVVTVAVVFMSVVP